MTLFFIFIASFFTRNALIPDTYYILFTKIDNQAKVWVNGELKYNSGVIEGNPSNLGFKVDLSNYLSAEQNKIEIQLYNGSEDKTRSDEHWEIYYEIFENNKPIEFIHEYSNNRKLGLVYSNSHEILIKRQ